ncbi:MAG: DNA mismatch repair endonuclease MutL, partial [Pirellulaceae bacterium]
MPRPIRQLPPSVVNKIAAGEVIERPASVVKELLENAVDAGASQIEVSIENGGLDLIRVTDNGSGIPHDELLLAVTSHATSKIQDAEELFQVGTFGFRGEALASIAEISELTLRSKTEEQESGYELRVHGGRASAVEPIGCPVGTSIVVENVFFNTPVRRKFMRSSQTEFGHISEAFARIALANPQCHLTLLHNGKVQFQLAPTNDWSVRIYDFFGPEIGDALIPIESIDPTISLTGFVVDPSVTRSHNRMQYLFLNGRYIRDRSLQHALSEAYRGLVMTGRFPICFLRLQMPYEMVDVNVHPAKLEVRFQDGGRIYSQLLATLRNKFLTTDLTARGQL